MVEDQGVEPCDHIPIIYSLANCCITVLPIFLISGTQWENQTPNPAFVALCDIHFTNRVYWICKLCHHRYWHHSPELTSSSRTRYATWDTWPVCIVLRDIHPPLLYMCSLFELDYKCVFLLLTLTKLGTSWQIRTADLLRVKETFYHWNNEAHNMEEGW